MQNELIEYYGYLAEEHNVVTEDGYNLTLFRCNSKNGSSDKKEVVVVHHGIASSSDDFCVADPSHALAYILADAGYDVWLSNARGNYYSRSHLTLNPNDKQFWNFTWYEIAIHDYPAIFDYIIKQTNQSKVYSIGHSQGTTCMMTLLSERPEYNDCIHAVSLMAPAAYMKHHTSIFLLVDKLYGINVRKILLLLYYIFI